MLRSDVQLISIGDHFDPPHRPGSDPVTASKAGVLILRWLAEHPQDQVTILLGNHDSARVMELIDLSDEAFREAAHLAEEILALEDKDQIRRRTESEFHARFARIPAPGLAARDLWTYSEDQRELVVQLLLGGRFELDAIGLPAALLVVRLRARDTDIGGEGGFDGGRTGSNVRRFGELARARAAELDRRSRPDGGAVLRQ
jgi:hypothetical protein